MGLKEIADAVLHLIDAGEYQVNGNTVRFDREQLEALKGTRLYTPRQIASLKDLKGCPPEIQITDGTTQLVANEITSNVGGPVGLLNFASARNPGGGFLNGAKAQEEDLCRCSGLYPCLLQCMTYYEENRRQASLLYTDNAIFTPNVPFFKVNGTGELLHKPFFVSVITAPAPNSGPFLKLNPDATEELRCTFVRRWRNVLRIARDQGISRLLLGAWGCGAFGGNPVMASQTAKEAIQGSGGGFDKIVFAIPTSGRQSITNFKAFRATFT